jgi:hypothetical protein
VQAFWFVNAGCELEFFVLLSNYILEIDLNNFYFSHLQDYSQFPHHRNQILASCISAAFLVCQPIRHQCLLSPTGVESDGLPITILLRRQGIPLRNSFKPTFYSTQPIWNIKFHFYIFMRWLIRFYYLRSIFVVSWLGEHAARWV